MKAMSNFIKNTAKTVNYGRHVLNRFHGCTSIGACQTKFSGHACNISDLKTGVRTAYRTRNDARDCTRSLHLGLPSGSNINVILKHNFSCTQNCFQDSALSPNSDNLYGQTETPPLTHLNLPLMTSRKLQRVSPHSSSRQAWMETLSCMHDEKLGIVNLHPDIFATFPRIDLLWWNIHWQHMYRKIDYRFMRNRAEMPGGGRKPWPQKGTGRARHGSIRSPLWKGGGKSFGPRGPKSYFFMLSDSQRVAGLCVALTCKYAQESLHIVDNLDIPEEDPEYLRNLIESRGWGLSVLFVDDTDIIPKNIALATNEIKEYNVMPVYGLNVHSMLKHETLVLTLAAVEKIEEKLLFQMHKFDRYDKKFSAGKISYAQPVYKKHGTTQTSLS